MVEFALIIPVMSIILLGLSDYAIAAFHTIELESAARSGAQYAMLDSSDTAVIITTVENSTFLDATNLTVTTTEFCECADGTTVACGGACASGNVRGYMQISAVYIHTPIFLPSTMTLTGESIFRTN